MNYYFFLDSVINFYIISSISNQLYQFTGESRYLSLNNNEDQNESEI